MSACYFEVKSRFNFPVLVVVPDLKYNFAHFVALITGLEKKERPVFAT
jgi:hypothetical protein